MAVLGFDLGPLRSAITELGQGVRQGAQQAQQPGTGVGGASGGDYLGYLAQLAPQPVADFRPQQQQQAGPGDYLGQLGQIGQSRGAFGAVSSTFAGLGQLATGGPGQFFADLASLADKFTADKAARATIGSGVGTGAAAVGAAGGGGPSSGMSPGVAKWAQQAQQTFGGIVDPDVMLAIMTNESGGDPNAYNAAGNAWGLFQQVGLNNNDPNAQFAAAKQLAQEKLAGINAAYAKNGINPDDRTRARDFALAWAGHFDYATGQPNPSSRDIGSGQTADQLASIFLAHYDQIKAGRQAGAGGGDWGGGLVGTPYVMGGLRGHPDAPQQGLDCSEFTAYVWGQKGVTLPWNAQQQYNNTARVDPGQLQPGDLVFFQGTDPNDPDYVTHVGIYVGGGKMINAQDNGVQYADLSSPYWQQHLAGYGRVAATSGGGTANR